MPLKPRSTMAMWGMAAPLPEATISTASGLAALILSACGVTLVSVRAKRSVATILMPAFASSGPISFSHCSP
ncbi:hypothetical protein D9M69_539150 [compost metagenome]